MLKKNMRMYTVFDMSGSAGASLEVGGIGSLKCYRFVTGKNKRLEEGVYSSTRFKSVDDGNNNYSCGSGGGSDVRMINDCEAHCVLDIAGNLPWVVIDIENDPTAFVVEISTRGFDPEHYKTVVAEGSGEVVVDGRDGREGCVETVMKDEENSLLEKEEEEEEENSLLDKEDDSYCENDDGLFVFWGDDDDEEDDYQDDDDKQLHTTSSSSKSIPRNQVIRDLTRAQSKGKPYVRYAFKCPSRKNEKAMWLVAFSKVGRLSDESKRKTTLFGKSKVNLSVNIGSTSQKNSRVRRMSSPSKAEDLQKLTLLGDSAAGLVGAAATSSSVSVEDSSALITSQKEYRVRPNYAYQHRWMTHAELTEEMLAPALVMHDTRLSPTVATDRRELGLMRVEVLQCRGLPTAKGRVKPNCVVYLVCGSYAFATDIIPQKVNPMWLRGMRRACALPVFHGYAVLMVGVFHDDGSKGSSAKDTFLGRVEVPIARLRPNKTYDVTLPLRESASVYNRDKLGAVRLRFSLNYYDQKQFILSYAPSMRNKIGVRVCTTVACADPKSFRNVALTVHGSHLPDRFSTNMFQAAIRELTFVQAVSLRFGKQYIRDLMYWRYPIFSAYCFGGWMFCVYSNSVKYVPIYLVGFALLHLASSYVYFISSEREDIRPFSWEELLLSLQNKEGECTKGGLGDLGHSFLRVLGPSNKREGKVSKEFPFSAFAGYSSFCVDECLNTSRLDSESEVKRDNSFNDEDMDEFDENLGYHAVSDDIINGLEKPLPEQNISIKKKNNKTIKEELEEVEEKVQKATKYLYQYPTYYSTESDEPPFGRKTTAERDDLDKMLGIGQYSQWNPIVSRVTSQFIPIIRILGVFLSIYRSFYSIVTWRDPIVTFWFSIAGTMSIAILLVFPWRLVFFLVGVLSFGPQNWVYRLFKEYLLDDLRNKKPGRVVRALREILKDDDGNRVWDRNDRANKQVQSSGSIVSQPLFRCHAPVSNPLMDRTNNVGPQHIVVPYSAVFFSRFSDWPPDPDHCRVINGSMTSNASLLPSSANDSVSVPKMVFNRKVESESSVDPEKNVSTNKREVFPTTESAKLSTTSSKPQQTQKETVNTTDRSQHVNVKALSSAAKTMGNRVAARMTAKLQPTLNKYKQVNKVGLETFTSKQPESVQSSDAKGTDEDTFDDGIPSVIETVTTNTKNDHDSQQNSEIETSMRDNTTDDPHWNDNDQAGAIELKQSIGDEGREDSLSKIDENQDIEATDALPLTQSSNVDVDEMIEMDVDEHIDPHRLSQHDNASTSEEEVDVLRSSPSSDSTNLLQQLMAIKLELATARTENDNYRKKLQETEQERDLYKEKLDHFQNRVGFLANTPLLTSKGKPTLFGKSKKTQTDTPQK